MKKRIILLLIISIAFIFNINIVKASAPETIVVSSTKSLPTYIGTGKVGLKQLSDGTVVYCLDLPKLNPKGIILYKTGELDAGMAWLIENGWPNKSFTGDDSKDAYLMQAAIWWYLDDTTGINNLSYNFKNNYSDPYGLKNYIYSLLDGAKNAKNTGYIDPSISLNTSSSLLKKINSEYFESEVITLAYKNVSGDYKVSLTNPNTNVKIIDLNGNERDTFNLGEGFKVRVYNTAFTDSLKISINLSVTATGFINKAYRYASTDNKYQPLVISTLYPEYKSLQTSLTLNGTTTKIAISKQDITTKEELPGAHLVIKDKDGQIIDEWTSTNEPHYIKDLTPGTYTLTETIAPDKYVLSEETITFEVKDDGNIVNVVMYNVKEVVEVPITDSNISPIIYLIGSLLIVIPSIKIVKYGKN